MPSPNGASNIRPCSALSDDASAFVTCKLAIRGEGSQFRHFDAEICKRSNVPELLWLVESRSERWFKKDPADDPAPPAALAEIRQDQSAAARENAIILSSAGKACPRSRSALCYGRL